MAGTPGDRAVLHPNVFLGLTTDGRVYIIVHRSEIGKGSRTALPRVVADAMDADWNRVRIVQAVGDPVWFPGNRRSRSILEFFEITAPSGVINQTNFNDYPMARINEAPYQTNVYVVDSSAPPDGSGGTGSVSWSVSHRPGALQRNLCCHREKDERAAAFEESAHLKLDFGPGCRSETLI